LIIGASIFSIIWGVVNIFLINKVDMDSTDVYMNKSDGESTINEPLNEEQIDSEKAKQINDELIRIGAIVEKGAITFLK